MARIPEETINRIKQDISLLRLVESQGLTVTRQGKDHVVSCPFHEEQTPSCIISPKTNLYHCFGCGAAGSVIDWVMKTQGVSFRFACELLQKDLGLISDSGIKLVKRSTATKLPPPLAADADNQTALRQVIDYYHETLKQSPEALDYLRSRGLDHPELIERFKLGFANRTLGYCLPKKNRQTGARLRGQLQEIGIIRDSGHEHFNGSLVVPIFNTEGNVVEVYGRKIRDDLRKGTARHLYLPDAHAGVWNEEGLQGHNVAPAHPAPATLARPCTSEVILCEALIDAMTFWVNGYKNVTASYGTSGFTPDHLAAFKRCGVERVLIAYDRDEAGNKAAEKLAKELQQQGFACYRLLFPKGMDANQYALEVTPANKSLGVVIRSAQWMGEGRVPSRDVPNLAAVARPTVEAPEPAEAMDAKTSDLPLPASPLPPVPPAELDITCAGQDVHLVIGNRRYRVRGLDKNSQVDQLKINLLVSCEDDAQGSASVAGGRMPGATVMHVDQIELYNAKARQGFGRQAAVELGLEETIIHKDLGKLLLALEQLQDERRQTGEEDKGNKPVALNEGERQAALTLLQDPKLMQRILEDFERCGVVGEQTNTLVGYLAASSRKLDKPLAVVIQSTSAAGKSSLMDAVLALMPEDERVQYSAMTGQSLFYMGETNLKNKILAIAEEEGAHNASYALKLLQSEGQITIASTGKDDSTGNMVTREYSVEGPVMLFLTTTAIDIDEELLNRCLVLTVNESREQTRAIHEAQRRRRTLAGLQAKLEKDELIKLHRNAQKLLKPLAVINPYADQLTFLDDKTRTRRDHEKYLTLIDTIAFLHQYQREIKTANYGGQQISFIEVQLEDIEIANQLAHEVLGRTLDELPAQTRKLLTLIQNRVQTECKKQGIRQQDFRFSRRDIREHTGWSDGQLKIHCTRLTDLEYLLVHRGGRGQHLVYELLFDGDGSDQPRMMGLIDPKKLTYDGEKSGLKAQKSGLSENKSAPSQAQVGAKSGPGQGEENEKTPEKTGSNAVLPKNGKINASGEMLRLPSYRHDNLARMEP